MGRSCFAFFSLATLLALPGCDEQLAHDPASEPGIEVLDQEPQLLDSEQIDGFLAAQSAYNPDAPWEQASDQLLWSALSHSEATLSLRIDDPRALEPFQREGKVQILEEYAPLHYVDIRVADYATMVRLRQTPGLSKLEPSDYESSSRTETRTVAGLGCLNNPDPVEPADVEWIEPGALVPWNYLHHNIPQAWETHADGSGITIGLVDTGLSKNQSAFTDEGWNQGWSKGRTLSQRGRYVDSIWRWAKKTDGIHDRCGHGSSMASILAGPRSYDNQPVGVAYRSNLVVYRATRDVFLDSFHEKKGVAKAILELADDPDVRVISLSVGYLFHVSRIADAIRYAHDNGKMVVAAAGTSTVLTSGAGVIFPASMAETVAVTGLLDTTYTQACYECHVGKEVDFSMVVQRASNGVRKSVAVGYRDGELTYAGGSSTATAMVAAIASMVWSAHPDWTRDQVRERLNQSAEFYPAGKSGYGLGKIDALKAVQ